MSARTSIELHADGCRIVEVEVRAPRLHAEVQSSDVRVRKFVPNLPRDEHRRRSSDLAAALSQIRKDHKLATDACVTIWGLSSAHQFLRLPPAKDSDLDALARREARNEIAPLETDGAGACVAMMIGPDVLVGTHRRREVSVIAVSEADVRRQIQPVTEAGFVVGRVVTPAIALTAVARSHTDRLPGSTRAYVALGAHATCVAIVRDGLLLFVREIAWGYAHTEHEPVETRLASELRRSILFFRQTFRSNVEGVVLCGDVPNLRALTAPVGTGLDLPIQTLDSLSGIDAERVPEPADAFRAEVASLRMAIAAGAEASTHANLLPTAISESRETRATMMRSVAALAAGVLVVFGWYAMVASSSSNTSEVHTLEQRIALLEPQSANLAGLRRASTAAALRGAALAAFNSQGPRLAHILDLLSQSTSDDIALTAIDVQADAGFWRTDIKGHAVTPDLAAGQSAVNRLLQRLSESPLVGPVVQPPSFRLISGEQSTTAERRPIPEGMTPVMPAGMTGVEFAMQFRVPR
jgi:Tfp pilus assembly PilM family ATPase